MAAAARPSNATLLARLRDGTAKFELLDDSALAHAPPAWPRLHCFARVASSLRGGWSAALNKVEHYGVQRVTGDGRCMFRALVAPTVAAGFGTDELAALACPFGTTVSPHPIKSSRPECFPRVIASVLMLISVTCRHIDVH